MWNHNFELPNYNAFFCLVSFAFSRPSSFFAIEICRNTRVISLSSFVSPQTSPQFPHVHVLHSNKATIELYRVETIVSPLPFRILGLEHLSQQRGIRTSSNASCVSRWIARLRFQSNSRCFLVVKIRTQCEPEHIVLPPLKRSLEDRLRRLLASAQRIWTGALSRSSCF